MKKATRHFPAEATDKAQYLARQSNDNTIRFALVYPGELQADALQEATATLVNRIDILHARFVPGTRTARWELQPAVCSREVFTLCNAAEGFLPAVQTAMAERIPWNGGAHLHCTLVTGNGRSAVVLRVGHMCCDGSDGKYLLKKLLEIYNCILNGKDPAAVQLKNGSRKGKQCSAGLTLADRRKLLNRPAAPVKTEYRFPEDEAGSPRILWETLPPQLLEAARKKGKPLHASVNDLLLSAYYRGTARQMCLPMGEAMGIQSMMDLRRHIPGGDSGGVCILSGSMPTVLPGGVGGSFSDTLTELVSQTRRRKEDRLAGLYDLSLLGPAFRLFSFSTMESLGGRLYGKATMSLTNLGALDGETLRAGDLTPTEGVFGGPVKKKPALQIAAIGVGGAVTLCSATCCTDADEQAIRALYALMRAELEAFACGGT